MSKIDYIRTKICSNCNRGHTSKQDFTNISTGKHGEQITYKCTCGEILHIHQYI